MPWLMGDQPGQPEYAYLHYASTCDIAASTVPKKFENATILPRINDES